jgi:nicotinamidase-related amidase
MDPKNSELLNSARRENRLAALHVDLQLRYHRADNARVFNTVAAVASTMRQIDLPNIWLGFCEDDHTVPPVSTAHVFNRNVHDRDRLHDSAGARNGETAIPKTGMDAFDPDYSRLRMHLCERRIDTLLVDGLFASQCVARTARSAVKSGYNVVLVTDAIADLGAPVTKDTLIDHVCGKSLTHDDMARLSAVSLNNLSAALAL